MQGTVCVCVCVYVCGLTLWVSPASPLSCPSACYSTSRYQCECPCDLLAMSLLEPQTWQLAHEA